MKNREKIIQQPVNILITSSRRPTKSMRTLMRDLHTVIPYSFRINRGKMSMEDIAELASNLEAHHVLIVERWKGGPGKIEFYKVLDSHIEITFPILYLSGVRLQREHKIFWRKQRIRSRSLAVANPEKTEYQRLAEALSKIFNVPLLPEEETKKFQIYVKISESKNRTKITFFSNIHNMEVGPALYIKKVSDSDLKKKSC